MRTFSLLVVACCFLLLGGCTPPPSFQSTDISGSDWGKDFSLTDHHGQPRRLADFKGKVVVLFFGYTQCPDVCPTTMNLMREVFSQLGEQADKVQVLFITLDPSRDTPQLLAEYVTAFHPAFLGLYGDEQSTAATAQEFKVFYAKHAGNSAGSYSIDHTAFSFAFDPQNRLRLAIRYGESPDNVASDLKGLLAGR